MEVDANIFKTAPTRGPGEDEGFAGSAGPAPLEDLPLTKEVIAGLLLAVVGAGHLTRFVKRSLD